MKRSQIKSIIRNILKEQRERDMASKGGRIKASDPACGERIANLFQSTINEADKWQEFKERFKKRWKHFWDHVGSPHDPDHDGDCPI